MTRSMTEIFNHNEIEHQEYPLVAISEEGMLSALNNPVLHRYLLEIAQYRLLTRKETDELAIQFRKTGNPEAGYRLVSANLRLVVKLAMDFQKHWTQNFMDLIQEGNIGLVQAAKKFDPDRGVKFSSYAVYWIRAYILKFIMDNWRLVKIGTTQAQRKLFFSLNKEKKFLEAQGYDPKPKLLAQRLNVKEKDVVEMSQRMELPEVSLESPVNSLSDVQRKNFLPAHEPGIETIISGREVKKKLYGSIETLKKRLNDRQKVILDQRLLAHEPLTLQIIADKFDISRERVRQIEVSLLKILRIFIESEFPDIECFFDGNEIAIS